MSKDAIDVNDTFPFPVYLRKSSIWSQVLGHLCRGMDIVNPLRIGASQKKFLLVAIDYFSKWVEIEAYVSIKDKDVSRFV